MATSPNSPLLPRALQEPRFVRGLPWRMKTILLATTIFLFFGSLIVFISALIVNQMKNQLVEVAREEVRQSFEYSRERIEEIAGAHAERTGKPVTSLAEISNDPEVRAELHIMSRNGAVLMTAFVDNEGATIVQTYGNKEIARRCPIREGKATGILPPSDEGFTWRLLFHETPPEVMTEQLPVKSAGQNIGYIQYGLEEDLAVARLDPISKHITNSLLWMVILVMIFLGLAIYLIHLAGARHMELQQRHVQSSHLASIGTMASGLAHEIRNPLHAMNLHLEATREELEDPRPNTPEVARKAITNVQRQIVALNTILSNFMNYALPSKAEKEPVRLAAVVGEVANLMSLEFEGRGITFHRDVPESAWINADPTAVRQVLTNVLINAAQAVEKQERREISLGVRREGTRWCIYVDDTGPGLPSDAGDIFEVFVSNRKGGTGFGLPIARRIMEEHEGFITGETRREGGSRFTLVFQATDEPKEYHAIQPATVG